MDLVKSYVIPNLLSTLNTFIIVGKNEKIDKLGNDIVRKIFNLTESRTIKPLYVQAGLLNLIRICT